MYQMRATLLGVEERPLNLTKFSLRDSLPGTCLLIIIFDITILCLWWSTGSSFKNSTHNIFHTHWNILTHSNLKHIRKLNPWLNSQAYLKNIKVIINSILSRYTSKLKNISVSQTYSFISIMVNTQRHVNFSKHTHFFL